MAMKLPKIIHELYVLYLTYSILVLSIVISDQCYSIFISTERLQLTGLKLSSSKISEKTVSDIYVCIKNCVFHPDCQSVNFNSVTGICELYAESHITVPPALVQTDDVNLQYYLVKGWDKAIREGCTYSTCKSDETCYSQPTRSNNVFQCVSENTVTSSTITTSSPTSCSYLPGCANCITQLQETVHVGGNITFTPKGCFHAATSPNPMTILLKNYRSSIDWTNIQLIIDGCAKLAYINAYPYFGIEYYGECWVNHTYDSTSLLPIDASTCGTKMYEGTGAASVMCIYEIK